MDENIDQNELNDALADVINTKLPQIADADFRLGYDAPSERFAIYRVSNDELIESYAEELHENFVIQRLQEIIDDDKVRQSLIAGTTLDMSFQKEQGVDQGGLYL